MNVLLMVFLILALSFLIRPMAEAQRRVDMRHTYERLIYVVPMVGKGTYDDPRRPKYAPASAQADAKSAETRAARTGIIAYHAIPSDDGQYALVGCHLSGGWSAARDGSYLQPAVRVWFWWVGNHVRWPALAGFGKRCKPESNFGEVLWYQAIENEL